ncbi:hypothetical protein [Desulfovibrio sp. JC022]|uniref:hypothetical protein n=1 Tax=Desulfovibrio sp. JC022 TaxID=2593642 RepID=UPI0013CFC3A4|nr:hypothetical protein [Desulfovibrio sp. JC022]NDV21273.1 hypothetical protein [Desulfovibrio sp. JC022]
MDIEEYLNKVNSNLQINFHKSIEKTDYFSRVHHIASMINEFSTHLSDQDEREMLNMVSSQLEHSSINLAFGMYRQAFAALRLSFELALGTVYFSVNKLEHAEWKNGTKSGDIVWSKLIDPDNGVLSSRMATAFFKKLSPKMKDYRFKAKEVYRQLSEYVHGNSETWTAENFTINYEKSSFEKYFILLEEVSEVILFALCCRYLKSLPEHELDTIDFIHSELSFVGPIREEFGGPKDI